MWGFVGKLCPDMSTLDPEVLDTMGVLLEDGREVTVADMRSALARQTAESKRLRSLYEQELAAREELRQRVQELEAEQSSLQTLNGQSQHDGDEADLKTEIETLQDQLRVQKQKFEEAQAEADESSRFLRKRVAELEREVQRLNATISTREAVAATADRQRRKQIEERESSLEAQLQSVREQVSRSQEMQEQLVAERKEIEEEKRLLEAEVLRQQDAAAELQKVIESFFPEDGYADSGLDLDLDDTELEDVHRSTLSDNPGSPPLCGSLDTSVYSSASTEDIIHNLHHRLNNIAVMWKAQDTAGLHMPGIH